MWPIGSSGAREVWQIVDSVASSRLLGRKQCGGISVNAEGRAHVLGHVGAVLSAHQRQPVACGVAEGSHHPLQVLDGLGAAPKERPACSQRHHQHSVAHRPSPESTHHIVPAPCGHDGIGRQAVRLRRLLRQVSQAGVRGQHRGQHGMQLRVDAAAQVRAEGVSERVEEGRAAGVPALSGVRAGQPEVEVVVGQHHLGHLVENLWLVLLHPQDFGGGEGGLHVPPKDSGELLGLWGGLCIAPQLGRPQHLTRLVHHHQTMLLTADSHGSHALGLQPSHRLPDGCLHAHFPSGRMLLCTRREL
mmetsp:Transcript_21338/g.40625  ORF Transcript_21338/g.40625 Transcript_21338/m.40625 type:complete len:302 (+) Transcript_21338:2680-3585(+)